MTMMRWIGKWKSTLEVKVLTWRYYIRFNCFRSPFCISEYYFSNNVFMCRFCKTKSWRVRLLWGKNYMESWRQLLQKSRRWFLCILLFPHFFFCQSRMHMCQSDTYWCMIILCQWLMPSEGGYLEAEGIEKTWRIKQESIAQEVDILSSRNQYDIVLPGWYAWSQQILLCWHYAWISFVVNLLLEAPLNHHASTY